MPLLPGLGLAGQAYPPPIAPRGVTSGDCAGLLSSAAPAAAAEEGSNAGSGGVV